MPVLMSPDIAAKFKEKWLSVYPEDQAGGTGDDSAHLDDSLTSLNWLQNFCILSADPEERWNGCPTSSSSSQQQLLCLRRLGFPQGGGSDSPSSPPAGDTAATGMPLYLGSPVTSGSDSSADPARTLAGYGRVTGSSGYHHHHHHHPHLPLQPSPPAEVDYKTNPKVKPPYSYASLICMAMQASKQPKVTLSTIYNWITENFCYYRHAEPSWQNSIRHNLSLNKCFMKVPRQKDEPGKGGFWQIDPQYADMFVNGIFKRRRMSANHYNSSSSNGHRQSKLLQGHDTVGYHRSQSGCLYQGEVGMSSTKRKYLSTKGNSDRNHSKAARMTPKSPLLATEAHGADMLRGDFDLASVFDDVLGGNCSNFEDLDINTALVSLGCEMEVSSSAVHHGHGTSMELGLQGRWCGANGSEGVDLQSQVSSHHQQSYGYMELSGAAVECHATMGDLQMPQQQQHPHHDQLLQPHLHHHQQQHHHHHHHPLHQFEEVSSLFLEQPEEVVVHPWGEIKEEEQMIPLTLDQGFGLCEGFFTEMQPWERVEAYL